MSREDEADPDSSRDVRVSAVREALKLLADINRTTSLSGNVTFPESGLEGQATPRQGSLKWSAREKFANCQRFPLVTLIITDLNRT